MMNINKIIGGYQYNNEEYLFTNYDASINGSIQSVQYEILSSKEAHIGTDKGVVFLDTSVTIDGNTYNTIQNFITALYS